MGDADNYSKWRRLADTGAPWPLSLHLGNAHVPPGSTAIKDSEDGGDRRVAPGRERGRQRLRQLLMHLREKRHRSESLPALRNQSSSREGSGLGSLLTSSPILMAARASMAVNSGSGTAVATTTEGGSTTEPSSSEDVSPSPDVAIDILSTDGAPN